MASQAIAARYAKALFEVSLKEADPRVVEQQLDAFAGLMAVHRDLQHVLTNPAVPVIKKQAVVKVLVDRQRAVPVVARTLVLLASRDRLALLPDLLANYRERLLAREGIVKAEVTTSAPLSPARQAEIERGLAAVTGKRVTMTVRVDPSLIAGVVARVGGVVYDASVATQLRKIRTAMTDAV
ncbi:MAG TPA: ATP synthase F1 subunit delta [Vicinamibacterales bacterium]|jgi:F-type H+-transporting ATPase subunit delta